MKNPNIILILIDAVRARNLGCYGYDIETSPNIDKIAEEGIVFENCFSCTNTTDSSLTTIFSGLYPFNHGITTHGEKIEKSHLRYLNKIIFLQDILRKNGYKTLAIDWLSRWHRRGFDYYSGPLDKKRKIFYRFMSNTYTYKLFNNVAGVISKFKNDNTIYYDNANSVTNKAINIINKYKNKNFFLFIHYWDTHTPYNPPKKYLKKLFINNNYNANITIENILNSIKNDKWRRYLKKWMLKAKNVEELLASYDAELSYIDNEIGRLVEYLNKLEILNDTILIITSDHGESLIEHGIYFDHHGLYDVNIHVPLIIRYPEVIHRKKVKSLVQHVDLVPTILELLEIKYNGRFDGKSLVMLFEEDIKNFRQFIYTEESYTQRKFAIRTYKYKYIFAPKKEEAICRFCGVIHGDFEELYDLENDPEELINIADKNFKTKKELKRLLIKFTNKMEKQKIKKKIKKIIEKKR